MSDEQATKKKRKIAWGALFWGTVGAAAAFRALYRPDRAIIRDGFVSKCSGASCDPTMTIEAYEGTQAIFAPMSATVIAVSGQSIYLVPKHEAVILEYLGVSPQVVAGDSVGSGQQIGLSSRLQFAVYEIDRTASGTAKLGKPVEPAAWLAVHGLTVSTKKHKGQELWCEGGRRIVVPAELGKCGFRLPPPSGYALLPVSVTTE
jgi:hypothetical protein